MQHENKIALTLSAIHLVAGAMLMLVAGWFIAACAIAGLAPLVIGFNYVVPATTIRMLALIRIVTGYGEKYFAHAELLNRVGQLRLAIFDKVFARQSIVPKAEQLESLDHYSEIVAGKNISIWHPLFGSAILLCFLIAGAFLIYAPYAVLLGIAVLSVVALCFIQYRQSLIQQEQASEAQIEYRRAIESDLESASLWQGDFPTKNLNSAQQWRASASRTRAIQAIGEQRLFALASLFLIWSVSFPQDSILGEAIVVLSLFLFLAFPDWFNSAIRAMLASAQVKLAHKRLASLDEHTCKRAPSNQVSGPASIKRLTLRNLSPQRASMAGCAVNLQLKQSQIALLQGSSGCGKSSILLAITGFLDYSGEVFINEIDLSSIGPVDRFSKILYVEQFPTILSDSLRRNLLIANPAATDERLASVLTKVGLADLLEGTLDQWVGETGRMLSGGEKKRLGLARALLGTASVWLLDEPFEGLDEQATKDLINLINTEREQRIIVIASHIPITEIEVNARVDLDEIAYLSEPQPPSCKLK